MSDGPKKMGQEDSGVAPPQTAAHPSRAASGWCLIAGAPTNGAVVDIWAKRWDANSDSFEHARYTDMVWQEERYVPGNGVPSGFSMGAGWAKYRGIFQASREEEFLPNSWRATHWRSLPATPEAEDVDAERGTDASAAEGDQATPISTRKAEVGG